MHEKGRFWFGSRQEGVALYDGSEFIYCTVSDGLSDHQVRTIHEDQAGVMWVGTGNGSPASMEMSSRSVPGEIMGVRSSSQGMLGIRSPVTSGFPAMSGCVEASIPV